MALASSSDVVDALGRALTADETTAVANMLDQASDLVVGYLGHYPDPVVSAVSRVTATMVAAVFQRPQVTTAAYDATGYATSREYAQVQVGEVSATSAGPWLTKGLKTRLRPYRRSVTAVSLLSEQRGGIPIRGYQQ